MGKLGDTLKERRKAMGLSVEQVQDATRIRGKLIQALEEGEYTRLPDPGYVRGYISSYARLLELDSVPLLAMYKSETGAGRFHQINLPQAEEAVVRRSQQHAVPARGALTVVLALALLSTSVWAVTRLWRGPESTLPEPAPLVDSTATSEADTGSAIAKSLPKQAVKLKPFSVSVSVATNGASWLKVTIDGKKAYEGTLTSGQNKTFEAAKSAKILIGKPSDVTVRRDGKSVKIPSSGSTPSVSLQAETIE